MNKNMLKFAFLATSMLVSCDSNTVNYELLIDLKTCVSVNEECKEELIYDYQSNQLAGCLIFLSEDDLGTDRIKQARFGFSVSSQGLNWINTPSLENNFAQTISAQMIFLDPGISSAVQTCNDPRILPDLNCAQSEICRLKLVEGGLALNDELKIDFKTDICHYNYGISAAGYESCMAGKTEEVCTIGQGICQSSGILIIDQNDPSKSTCNAAVIEPEVETCVKNELDDDCDGKVDEESGMVGQRCTLADGCTNRGVYGCNINKIECTLVNDFDMDEKECDLIDADCDGKIDEAYQKQPTICNTGCSPQGYKICTNEGLKDTCISEASAAQDLCDGIDNDCDQKTDEDAIASSYSDCGVGVCAARGESRCVMGEIQVISECMPDQSKQTMEICDDLDNNCDGVVDDGFDKLNDPMNCGTCGKVCEGQYPNALYTCMMGQCVFSACRMGFESYDQQEHDCTCSVQPEMCNGIDDDCDLREDEDLIAPISMNQQGECLGSYQICDVTTGFREPNAMERSMQNPNYSANVQEVCDGLDNNCNNTIDENYLTEPAGLLGVCANATKKCVAGRLVPIEITEYMGYQNFESCDGLDNNCNGSIDEAESLMLDNALNQLGVCSGSKRVCDNTVLREPNTQELQAFNPKYNLVESCDALDNDCDGRVDENYEPKVYYLPGVCANVVFKKCIGNNLYQNLTPQEILALNIPNYNPNTDGCDRLDNDCDGRVDENPPNMGMGACPP